MSDFKSKYSAVKQKPYFENDRAVIFCGDCLDILPHLSGIDAVVTDPPYGMNYIGHSGGGRSVHSGKRFNRTSRHIKAIVAGDDKEFDPTPWLSFPCAMLGPQWYYHKLPPNGSLHSWDKRGDYKRCSFADADFVWINRRIQAQTFRLVWRGICRHSENCESIVHPTQKPIDVMKWMLDLLGVATGSTVLDPYAGSGTTGVASLHTGRKFIGIEIELKYVEIAAKRIAEASEWDALLRSAQ